MANCPQFINFYFAEIVAAVNPGDTTITVAGVSYLPTLVTGGDRGRDGGGLANASK